MSIYIHTIAKSNLLSNKQTPHCLGHLPLQSILITAQLSFDLLPQHHLIYLSTIQLSNVCPSSIVPHHPPTTLHSPSHPCCSLVHFMPSIPRPNLFLPSPPHISITCPQAPRCISKSTTCLTMVPSQSSLSQPS